MNKSIELVSHCFSGDKVPIYHLLAQLQFGSLLRNPPSINTTISICYHPDDKLTTKIIDWFDYERRGIETLFLNRIPLPKEKLFRRAIGRNIAAKHSLADVIWFTDIDYLFTDSSTLRLAHHHCMNSKLNMVRPEVVNIHRSHGFGDVLIDRLKDEEPYIPKLDPDHFMPEKYKRTIGGIQIVQREAIRKEGYLDNTKWTRLVSTSRGFRQCMCDIPFRKQVGSSEAVDIPGVYRIRHSRCGRDGGIKDHSEGK